jgi:hypothetical protein
VLGGAFDLSLQASSAAASASSRVLRLAANPYVIPPVNTLLGMPAAKADIALAGYGSIANKASNAMTTLMLNRRFIFRPPAN